MEICFLLQVNRFEPIALALQTKQGFMTEHPELIFSEVLVQSLKIQERVKFTTPLIRQRELAASDALPALCMSNSSVNGPSSANR